MKNRTMERNVLYFMPAIVQQAKQSCGQAKHHGSVDKKTWRRNATSDGSH